MATTARIPTIDDLRVKLCYICREEEVHGDPLEAGSRPRSWTHPCKCTLIAHEQCLLKWIATSQANQGRAPNALKCPQCGAAYEIESDNPALLKVLGMGHSILQRAGSFFLVSAIGIVVGIIGSSVYFVCTGYGAWAVRKFIGNEMFALLFGNDPSNWPWSAYINLPLLPFSLILTRFQVTSSLPPFIPILLAVPSSFSINRKVGKYWGLPESTRKILGEGKVIDGGIVARSWPPSPVLFGLFGLPMIQMLYKRLYSYVYLKVMGVLPPDVTARAPADRNANANGGRRNMHWDIHIADDAQEGDGGARIRVREQRGPQGVDDGDEQAEQVIRVNAGSLGRKVAGALMMPAVASWMGNLLLRSSYYSPLLREFLAVRDPVGGVWVPPPLDLGNGDWHTLAPFKQMSVGLQVLAKGLWGSVRTFSESDPVWWRNSVGLGLFIVAKDCLQLFHLWLSKRELASRKVKNRDFSGVDIRELDLIPSFETK